MIMGASCSLCYILRSSIPSDFWGHRGLRESHPFRVVVLGVSAPERGQCSGRMAPKVRRRSTQRLSLDVLFLQQPVPHQTRGVAESKGRISAVAVPIPSCHGMSGFFWGFIQPSRSIHCLTSLCDRFCDFPEKNYEHDVTS